MAAGNFTLPESVVKERLEEFAEAFRRNDKNALIRAIRCCGRERVVMPEWVVTAFAHATSEWYSMRYKELGEALGLQWPKGKHIAAFRQRRELALTVFSRVQELHNSGSAIDVGLYERVGQEFGIKATLVGEYCRAAKMQIQNARSSASDKLLDPYRVK